MPNLGANPAVAALHNQVIEEQMVENDSSDNHESRVNQPADWKLLQDQKAVRPNDGLVIGPVRDQFGPIAKLTPELFSEILENMHPRDLFTVRNVNYFTRSAFNRLMHIRLRKVLDPFFTRCSRALKLMNSHNIYVVGSLALAVLHGIHFSLAESNLDLVATDRASRLLIRLLHREGYIDSMTPHYNPRCLVSHGFLLKVVSLCRDGRSIEVIVVDDHQPLLALPSFWSTALMNAVNFNHIYVLYPKLTFMRQGLIHSFYLRDSYFKAFFLEDLKKKYAKRGYEHLDVLSTCQQLKNIDEPPIHIPSMAASTTSPRSTDDRFTLHYVLKDDPRKDARTAGERYYGRMAVWRLGGIGKEKAGSIPYVIDFRCRSSMRNMPCL